jgi:hypothetical protein
LTPSRRYRDLCRDFRASFYVDFSCGINSTFAGTVF